MVKRLLLISLVCLISMGCRVNAASWDLAGDWSDSANPNGTWSYEVPSSGFDTNVTTLATQSGEVAVGETDVSNLTERVLLKDHTDTVLGDGNTDFPAGNQPGWQIDAQTMVPILFKSKGMSVNDVPKGLVAGHSPFLIRWTSPADMTVDISGGVWMPREKKIMQKVSLGRTDADGKSSLIFDKVPIPWRTSSFDSGNPFSLGHAAFTKVKSGKVLKNITVKKGDSIWAYISHDGSGDFVGINLSVTEAQKPDTKSPKYKNDTSNRLFSIDKPESQWVELDAEGLKGPVTGVIYRKDTPATCGLALGGVDTGCIDLETSGLWGMSTIFNTHVPRRGPINLPFLGISVEGKTWVLCDPDQTKPGMGNFQPPFSYNMPHHMPFLEGQGLPVSEPYVQELNLDGVETPDEIHYWGHYPVADIEYEMDAPVSVGVRSWTPFIPGDVTDSMIPAAIFEVHIRNNSQSTQKGTVAFNFPGPTALEAGTETFERNKLKGKMTGCEVKSPNADYIVAVLDEKKARVGGGLDGDAEAWAKIAKQLPAVEAASSDSSLAVDFKLRRGKEKVIRYLVTWYAPDWKGGGKPWATTGTIMTHMYAKHYPSAQSTAKLITKEYRSLLKRVLAWQDVVYSDKDTPGWLADSMINSFYMITETGMWAQAKEPLKGFDEELGLFGMNECPRTCPQIECIPCGFYGNLPLVLFFPELALSTYKGYSAYMFEDGAAPWVWGGWTAGAPPIDFAVPVKGYQWTTNGISWLAMLDRFLVCRGDEYPDFVKEFYPVVKKNMIYTAHLQTSQDYTMGQRILMMPDGRHAEWFEAGNPQWFGMTTHSGALHLAQLQIAKRFADLAGDKEFSDQCQQWYDEATAALDKDLWNGEYYLNCYDPVSGRKDDLVFAFQLDGEWIADTHGLPSIFKKDRIDKTLATIKRCNASISQYGVVNYANSDGTPAPVGGYGTYSWFPPEVIMLSMNYMYEGQKEYGMQMAKKCWENIICGHRYTWDMPNIIRGDKDTGERGFYNGGHDYYQDMMIWSLPAAIKNTDFSSLCKDGHLVDRMIKAGQRK